MYHHHQVTIVIFMNQGLVVEKALDRHQLDRHQNTPETSE
jgi:hypothetical protein